jgi:chaperone modulatory protein CbpM
MTMSPNEILELNFEHSPSSYTLHEICDICQSSVDRIRELIDYGVINPIAESSTEWRFTIRSVAQARRAFRLERDLELNLAGIALALELIDENEQLRHELQVARAHLARFFSL